MLKNELEIMFDQHRAAGFAPLALFGHDEPVKDAGKRPRRGEWQKYDSISERAALRDGDNIGWLCGHNIDDTSIFIGSDLDFDDDSAVTACLRGVQAFNGRPVRYGAPGRALVPLRMPAGTLSRDYKWRHLSDGRIIKMQIIAGGRQFVAAGIHPGTKQPYRWDAGDWSVTRWPVTTLDELLAQISAAVAPLGFVRVEQLDKNAPRRECELPIGMTDIERETLRWWGRNQFSATLAGLRNKVKGQLRGTSAFAGCSTVAPLVWAEILDERELRRQIFEIQPEYDIGRDVNNGFEKGNTDATAQLVQIRNAERAAADVTSSDRSRTRLATYEVPAIDWRIRGMLPCIGTGFVFAAHYAGKTALVVDLIAAMTCGTGQLWAEQAVRPLTTHETVLIVAFEGHLGLKSRVIAASKHRGGDISPGIHMIVPDCGKQAVHAIRAELELARRSNEPCAFVMLDTWSASCLTLDDNSANEVAAVLADFNKIALEYRVCIAFLDHITKNPETGKTAPRGSSAKLANTSFGYALDGNRLVFEKVKDAERPKEVNFETGTGHDGAVIIKWERASIPESGGYEDRPSKREETDNIKLNISSYASGMGIAHPLDTDEIRKALDAGVFVVLPKDNPADFLALYGISGELAGSIAMICARSTFDDSMRSAFKDSRPEAVRKKIERMKARGHVLMPGNGATKMPIVIMRGAGWVPHFPWAHS